MSNPTLQAVTRLRCIATDLAYARAFIPASKHAELNRTIVALEHVVFLLEGLPSPAPTKQREVEAPSWGAGVQQ